MFDYVRKHNKIMQVMLFMLIVPSFVLFGIDGYKRFRDRGEDVASIAGESVSQEAWDQAHRQEVERLRASMPNLDAKLLDSPTARYATLEKMVRDRVLFQATSKYHVTVSNQRVADELMRDEFINSLRGPDGKLDMDRYRKTLAQQGLTPEQFEARLRTDLASRQVLGAVYASGLNSTAAADTALNAFFQRRTVAIARFDANQFSSKVQTTDAEIEQYYKDHLKDYQLPEKADVEYLVLDMDAVRKSIVLQEADLRSYYEQNATRLSGQEERRASHILIAAGKSLSAADRQKAKDKATQLQAQLVKAPQTFAEIARKESQDPGSAAQGGDLDFFARGAMTKPFEDAVFSMKKGDISPVVESEFGFHIIRLTDVKEPKTRSFEDMRKDIEADVRKQMAQKKYAELAETFTNSVYEQSDTYKAVAEKLKLDVRTAQNLSRTPATGATSPLANTKLLSAIFSADSLEKKRNTEAIEIAANTLASARITRYEPAKAQALADVKDKVRAALVLSKSAQLARTEGAQQLQAVQTTASHALSFDPAQTISRVDGKGLPSAVVQSALKADASKLPAYVGVDLGDMGYAIVKVTELLPSDQPAAAAAQARQQLSQTWAGAEAMAYYNLLKERLKVTVKPKPSAAPAGAEVSGSK